MTRNTSALHLSAALLVVVAIVRPGDGLHCYRCHSLFDETCDTHPNKTENCDYVTDYFFSEDVRIKAKPVCIKVIYKDIIHGDAKLLLRRCIPETSEEPNPCEAVSRENPQNTIIYCGTCEGDLCNNSNRFAVTFLLLLLPCFISLILSHIH
ncbi:uncharacterized protein LOC124612830 [Schistocerca americana]|uniref:uncharacterized protein LOC124612830 n=1 Tax=Schistocerca americana TaxID=7009 RepID=UPI001F4FE424|nr:uncharacterized protein LOC124612830 [Schistocerca americana]